MGMRKYDKEGLTFQFNADGTFMMGEEGKLAQKSIKTRLRILFSSFVFCKIKIHRHFYRYGMRGVIVFAVER
jgi:hypothetical protein